MKHLRLPVSLFYLLIPGILLSTTPNPSFDYLSQEMRQSQVGGLLTSLIASIGIFFAGKTIFSNLPNARGSAKYFVEDIAQEHGINPDFQVKLSDGYGAGINTITIPASSNFSIFSTLDYALMDYYDYANDKEELEAAEHELNEHIGCLDHEFTHYKNHDVRNSLIVCSLINLAVYSAYFTYEYNVLAEKLRTMGSFKKWLYTYSSSIGLSLTTTLLNCWYKRFQEKRADEGIRNEVPVLKAMISCFKRFQQNTQDYLISKGGFAEKFSQWLEKYPSLNLLLDPIHPPLQDRINRLQERIDSIETSATLSA